MAHQAKVVSLGNVLGQGFPKIGILVRHEGVAQIHMEIRFVSQHIGQSLFIYSRTGPLVEVGICLDGETELTTGFALCTKRMFFRACKGARCSCAKMKRIKILGIRF